MFLTYLAYESVYIKTPIICESNNRCRCVVGNMNYENCLHVNGTVN